MKAVLKRVNVIILTTMIFLSLSTTAFAGLSEPKETWNLKEKGKYTFEGNASRNDLYSNYLFTGTTRVEIFVINKGEDELTVKLFEKNACFFLKQMQIFPEKEKQHGNMMNWIRMKSIIYNFMHHANLKVI